MERRSDMEKMRRDASRRHEFLDEPGTLPRFYGSRPASPFGHGGQARTNN